MHWSKKGVIYADGASTGRAGERQDFQTQDTESIFICQEERLTRLRLRLEMMRPAGASGWERDSVGPEEMHPDRQGVTDNRCQRDVFGRNIGWTSQKPKAMPIQGCLITI